ncbi:hypothetical protein RND81_02G005200 [Saponaria officinalis]|uniref:DUF3511 domain-containing protein n=1 Tax=Saponaria officinalis TaxID=3572 RepID=A0AAW1MQ34_SAPOF
MGDNNNNNNNNVVGSSYGFESRRDRSIVTSGRVHSTKDGSPELLPYELEVSRSSRESKNGKKKKKWGGLSDAEMKRKKRVVKYKVYSMEGKVKASLKKGLRWFKNKVNELVHGY